MDPDLFRLTITMADSTRSEAGSSQALPTSIQPVSDRTLRSKIARSTISLIYIYQ